ncbi:MAG: hypothetical protein COA79_22060 [Planctomycetota bacterium]|nr:MAG: hypothetical protein COA79_22060 [Planctomycetota bacterium]
MVAELGLSYGVSLESEAAVALTLEWLSKNQEADGHWSSKKHSPKETSEVDTAGTGLAILCFLSSGHNTKKGSYKNTIKKALSWLVKKQEANGRFDHRNYSNGICTMAISEAAGMGLGGSLVKKARNKATDYLLSQQNASGGYNYKKSNSIQRNDLSITGWSLMGLRSAMLSGYKKKQIQRAFLKFSKMMDRVKGSTGDHSPDTKGLAWYTSNGKSSRKGSATQAIALLLRQYQGSKKSDPWLVAASNDLFAKQFTSYETFEVYQSYYSSLALFEYGGEPWKNWNKKNSMILIKGQKKEGKLAGSWGSNGLCHSTKGGRIVATSMACLILQTVYRYPRMK